MSDSGFSVGGGNDLLRFQGNDHSLLGSNGFRLGGSGLLASFLATAIGQFMYMATMTEAPFVHKLLSLGMGKGPALALLLTGSGMSLPHNLAIIKVFGFKRAIAYVLMITVLGTFAGWFAGNFIFS